MPEPKVVWRSESDAPMYTRLTPVDDRLRADDALRRVKRGEHLLYTGDFHNARQLLTAMGRRLERPSKAKSALEAFREEREARHREHETLSRIIVALDAQYRLQLSRAPDVARTCLEVWGDAHGATTHVSFKTLLGMLGAAQWRAKGLEVPGLKGTLTPHWGVFTPTRTEYVELLAKVPVEAVKGARVFDVGTGTGVLGFVLLQRGAANVVATDIEERAVKCARENAKALGLANRFSASVGDLFPEGRAGLVVFNAPWIPEAPKNRADRAVYDEDGAVLRRFLSGLAEHLEPGGLGLLFLSDLPVLLGLRSAEWLQEQLSAAGLEVVWSHAGKAHHPKAKTRVDQLHSSRAKEVTTLYALRPRSET
ncbi:MAG: 50S ribosomal protein L11 methyltransferase [Myxococcaceae bacterium]|nr:50S ribosomal protein L11 methyltransferase [Myxococcaceae bacterium]